MNYSQLSSEFTSKFFGLVNQANKIIITAHESPDEDSIASVLSVYDILSHRYPKKNIRIIYSSEPEDKFRIFKNYDKIEFVTDLADEISGTDLLILLDGSQFSRFTKQPEKIKAILNTIKQTLWLLPRNFLRLVKSKFRNFNPDTEPFPNEFLTFSRS